MSLLPPESPGSRAAISLRAVLVIVLAGIALGVAFNALQRDVDPARALPWVKGERAVAKLELESHPPPRASSPAPPVPASAITEAPAKSPAAGRTSARVSLPTRTPGASSFVSRAPRLDASTASGAPVGTDEHPPLSPPLRVPAAADPASAAAALPQIADSREPMDASLDVVRRLQAAGAAVILDARSPREYAAGHIAGALSLPFDEVFKHPERARAVQARGRPVVAYCDGGDCELSRSLAFALIDAGLRKVLVFGGGLPAWRAAGLAVHAGAQP